MKGTGKRKWNNKAGSRPGAWFLRKGEFCAAAWNEELVTGLPENGVY
jgi:hypothetical protein